MLRSLVGSEMCIRDRITGYAINPARDFGPRMCWVLWRIVYGQGQLWEVAMGNGYVWVPVIAPLCGSWVGTKCWDLLMVDKSGAEQSDELESCNSKTGRLTGRLTGT
eukprot:TRINITY_DN30333_c0_g2_i1.p2 TRINITY_DN30333_c0_g2~~TRINITY_DN30333_c0_g2_i1.p2  ORF type:complete len:116 (+),score=18.28 TRINITY_DN30333_c0_g2_i1:28-348(+)